jgi:hypothetical protein
LDAEESHQSLHPDGGFYGNIFVYTEVTDTAEQRDAAAARLDHECQGPFACRTVVGSENTWGPLSGSLLNLSYGYGEFTSCHMRAVGGQMQGGCANCRSPICPPA